MKKLLLILITLPLFVACSSDETESDWQEYTSFVVWHGEDITLINCVAAYKNNGKYYKLGNLGNLLPNKQSNEIVVENESVNEIYVFTDYGSTRRLDIIFTLKENYKNVFEIPGDTKGIPITDNTDPTQYPQ